VYVFHTEAGWQAQFVGASLERDGAINKDGLLANTRVDLPLELFLQFVPLSRRSTIETDRRRNPIYPLMLPCDQCGNLTPSSFKPVGDGTWVAHPRCDDHVVEQRS
jgi:hypothetical protein